jgi:hypothetical protein
LKFEIEIGDQLISIKLLSTKKVEESKLFFELVERADYTEVFIKNESEKVVNSSKYKKLEVS